VSWVERKKEKAIANTGDLFRGSSHFSTSLPSPQEFFTIFNPARSPLYKFSLELHEPASPLTWCHNTVQLRTRKLAWGRNLYITWIKEMEWSSSWSLNNSAQSYNQCKEVKAQRLWVKLWRIMKGRTKLENLDAKI